MPLFLPDQVLPHDPAGWGRYLLGHFLEHQQFVTISAGLTPPVSIPQYAIQQWSDEPRAVVFWLNSHYQIHQALRALTGVSGIDLSLLDFRDDSAFEVWQEDHSAEHGDLREVFGVS